MKNFWLFVIVAGLMRLNGCLSIKVKFESDVESYTSFSVQRELFPAIHVITKNTYTNKGILLAVGSAVYSSNGEWENQWLAGKLGNTDNRPESSDLGDFYWLNSPLGNSFQLNPVFNATSGLAELPDGKLAVADFSHSCVKVIDRKMRLTVSTLVGHCATELERLTPVGTCVILDGSFEEASFCNPRRLTYLEHKNVLLVLDTSVQNTHIRYVDLNAKRVTTLTMAPEPIHAFDMFYANKTESLEFMLAANKSLLLLSYKPAVIDAQPKVHCLLGSEDGCLLNKYIPAENLTDMAVDGDLVAFVAMESDGESSVYLLDKRNLRLTELCSKVDIFCPSRTASLAFIDGYLYLGGSSYYTTGDIGVSRIKYSIAKDDAKTDESNWIKGIRVPHGELGRHGETQLEKNADKVGGAIGGTLAVLFVAAIAFILYKRIKYNRSQTSNFSKMEEDPEY